MGSFSPVGVKEYQVRKVVIDAGHGGKDTGAVGQISKEKNIALAIALELGKTINKYMPDLEVVYSRKDDSFPSLIDRSNLANKNGADLFISIHCNSAPYSNRVRGTETYVMGLHTSEKNLAVAKRENASILLEENYEENYDGFDPNSPESHIMLSLFQNAHLENSLLLAKNIEEQFEKRVGRKSRGVKQAGFLVLWRTNMPSVLVEVGYLSNPREERELNDDLTQVYIASGIFRAFREYKEKIESISK